MSEINMVSKITVKTVKCKPAKAKAEERRVPMMRCFGIASGLKTVVAANGDVHTAITGDFKAQNIETGDTFVSGVLYLPAGIHDLLQSAVDGGLDKNDKPVYRPVKFGLDIYAVPSTVPAGYSYEATPIIEAQEDDRLAELAQALPALPSYDGAKADAESGSKAKAKA